MMDYAIECAYLILPEKQGPTVKENHWIFIKDQKIESVKPAKDVQKPQMAKKIISLKNHLVCPGLINTHTHLPMVMFRGLGGNLSLQDWLNKIIFPLEKKMVNPEFIRIGTGLACLELIKNGTTCVCDMYFHTSVMAEVLEQFGLRGMLAVDMMNIFSDFEKELDVLHNKHQSSKNVYPSLACHSPYTCSPQVLKQAVITAQKRNLPISIHVAETKWEVNHIYKEHKKSPVQYLESLGFMEQKSIFAHSVHLSEEDLNIVAQHKNIGISYNPESNMKLGSGTAPILRALEKGIPVGLGTDGSASNNDLNLLAEMDTGAKLQKLKNPEKIFRTEDVFSMAADKGAEVLGLDKQIGQIKAGFLADIMALSLDHPQFYPRQNLLEHLVYSAGGAVVDFVMCGGKVLMKDSKITNPNISDIYQQAEELKIKIHKEIKEL